MDLEGSSRGLIKVLARYSPGETAKNHRNLSQDCQFPRRDLYKEPLVYEARDNIRYSDNNINNYYYISIIVIITRHRPNQHGK
jgi:hypothetical protein